MLQRWSLRMCDAGLASHGDGAWKRNAPTSPPSSDANPGSSIERCTASMVREVDSDFGGKKSSRSKPPARFQWYTSLVIVTTSCVTECSVSASGSSIEQVGGGDSASGRAASEESAGSDPVGVIVPPHAAARRV